MEDLDQIKQQLADALQRIETLERDRVGILHQHNGNDSSKIPFTSVTGAGQYGRYYDIAFAGIMTFQSESTTAISTKFYITGYNGNSVPALQITASVSGVGSIDIGGAIQPSEITLSSVDLISITGGRSPSTASAMYVADDSVEIASASSAFQLIIPDLAATPDAVMATGTAVTVSSSITLPSPLVAGTVYYVIKISSTTFKFATTLALANAGTAIDLTTAGSGTLSIAGMGFRGALASVAGILYICTASAMTFTVNTATDLATVGTAPTWTKVGTQT